MTERHESEGAAAELPRRERFGNWLQTVSGRAFYPLDVQPDDIAITDIAHALSHICRFGGHCQHFYSVAEHSVRVSEAIEADIRGSGPSLWRSGSFGGGREALDMIRWGLLHDAAEAYVGDMVWPLKQCEQLHEYTRIEASIMRIIAAKYGLSNEEPSIVKRFDLVLLATEKRDLLARDRTGGSRLEAQAAKKRLGEWASASFEPLVERIEPWSAEDARHLFIGRFFELGMDDATAFASSNSENRKAPGV